MDKTKLLNILIEEKPSGSSQREMDKLRDIYRTTTIAPTDLISGSIVRLKNSIRDYVRSKEANIITLKTEEARAKALIDSILIGFYVIINHNIDKLKLNISTGTYYNYHRADLQNILVDLAYEIFNKNLKANINEILKKPESELTLDEIDKKIKYIKQTQ